VRLGYRFQSVVGYVMFATVFRLVAALAIDVAQQLMFFSTWAPATRSWAVTVIATPVATIFARAQWKLQRAKDALEDLTRTDPLTGYPTGGP
jgi:hypothetical protein